MDTKWIALRLSEDKYGASGDLDWDARVKSISDELVDHVYESLLEEGISFHEGFGDYPVERVIAKSMDLYRVIQDMMAAAMVNLFDRLEQQHDEVLTEFVSNVRKGSPF